jgi:hypothetical protein
MTPRIRVIGYLDVDEYPGALIDLDNPTGLSEEGFNAFTDGRESSTPIGELDELSFEVEDEDEDEDDDFDVSPVVKELSDALDKAHEEQSRQNK